MKRMIGMVAVVAMGLVGANGAAAGTLKGTQRAMVQYGTNGMAQMLAFGGVTNALDQAAVMAAWDEDVFVDQALKVVNREKVYWLLGRVMERDQFGAASRERIKAVMLADISPSSPALDVIGRFPLNEREALRGVAEAAGAVRYAAKPEYGRLAVKYGVLRGVAIPSQAIAEEDLVRYLVSPEPLALAEGEKWKNAVKERATMLARMKLRAEGKSFVTTTNGVNPLVTKVLPVVTALNAPSCAGLEAALRELGSALPDIDRKPMQDLVAGWQPKIMSGEMPPAEVDAVMGKVAVTLGSEEYNRFVDGYNNGTAGVK